MFVLLVQAPNLEGPPRPFGPFETADEASRFEDEIRAALALPREQTEGLWGFDTLPLSETLPEQWW